MTADRSGATELEGVVAQAALVEYQPGAVVSPVTAFAFDAGEGLAEPAGRRIERVPSVQRTYSVVEYVS